MDILIQINSGNLDTIIPGLVMATRLKNEGADVAVSFQWRALVTFAERHFEFSPSVTRYVTKINENAEMMGFPPDYLVLPFLNIETKASKPTETQ